MFYKFRNRFSLLITVFIAALSLFASACSSSDSASSTASSSSASSSSASSSSASSDSSSSAEEVSVEKPSIVVTTNILGDVVASMVGDLFEVETIMPPGADPHVFQASAQQVNLMMEADLLVVNGANFEEGLLDVIKSAESDGVMVVEAMSFVEAIESDGHDDHDDHDEEGHDDHDDHDEEGHDDHDDHDDHDEEGHDDHDDHDDHAHHDHGGIDPHFFTDPARMASVVEGLSAFLVQNFPAIDEESLLASSNAYLGELNSLDSEVEEMLSSIPEGSRKLITNHSVFAYFADRYDFEILGSIIQSSSTLDSASAKDLADLVSVIEDENVSAIFADAASSDTLAQVLADEAGDIQVISLFTESLGEAGSLGSTYIDMVRTNAELISGGLTN